MSYKVTTCNENTSCPMEGDSFEFENIDHYIDHYVDVFQVFSVTESVPMLAAVDVHVEIAEDMPIPSFDEFTLYNLIVCVKELCKSPSRRKTLEDFVYELLRQVVVEEWKFRLGQSMENFVSVTWPLLSREPTDECSIDSVYNLFHSAVTASRTNSVTYRWKVLLEDLSDLLKRLGVKQIARQIAADSNNRQQQMLQFTEAMPWIHETIEAELDRSTTRSASTLQTPWTLTCVHERWMRTLFVVDDKLSFFGSCWAYMTMVSARLVGNQCSEFYEGLKSLRLHALSIVQETVLESIIRRAN